jgi:hypothetical protein
MVIKSLLYYKYYMNYKEIKNKWVEFLYQQDFTHAVTLKPNHGRKSSFKELEARFYTLHMLVQRKLLGRRFNRCREKQTHAFAIVEGLPFVGHLHAAFKIDAAHQDKFEALFPDGSGLSDRSRNLWRKLEPTGSSKVERIFGAQGWISYASKEIWSLDDLDRVILLPMN